MIYLDHAATTPVDQRVLEVMLPYFTEEFGNASSLYAKGRKAKSALDTARNEVADLLKVYPRNLVFTSGGTESCNLALFGCVEADLRADKHIIVSKIEHSAVLKAAEKLEAKGIRVTYLDVDTDGFVDLEQLKQEINEDTVLVSIIYANNEIGVVQDMAKIAEICRDKEVLLHTDACQAAAYLSVDFESLPVDLLSLNASKMYGPKGVGVLAYKDGVKIAPQIMGGGQEFGLRSGTENIALIKGLAEAFKLVSVNKRADVSSVQNLRDYLLNGLLELADCQLTGSKDSRLPNHISLIIGGIEGESMLMRLDQEGIAVSTGSACSSGSLEPSHVLKAIGLTKQDMYSSLRITLGKDNTKQQMEKALVKIKRVVEDLRSIGLT